MVIDLIITITDDGCTSEVPSIKGCESWAHKEDDAIDKSLELVAFYLRLPNRSKIKVDLARKEADKKIYKLIFNKEIQ